MPDTRRELAALQALHADNTAGDISPQDNRDGWQTAHPSLVVQSAAFAGAPATGQVTGDLFLPTDGASVDRFDGSAWKPWGPIYPLARATDPGTWVNQGSASASASGGHLYLTCPASGGANNAKLRVKSAPTAPYTITALLAVAINPGDTSNQGLGDGGLCWRESATGKVITFGPQPWYNQAAKLILAKWDSATSLNSTFVNVAGGPTSCTQFWVQLVNDSTNLVVKIGVDGANFLQVDSHAKATFFTTAPDQVGVYVNPYEAGTSVTVLSANW